MLIIVTYCVLLNVKRHAMQLYGIQKKTKTNIRWCVILEPWNVTGKRSNHCCCRCDVIGCCFCRLINYYISTIFITDILNHAKAAVFQKPCSHIHYTCTLVSPWFKTWEATICSTWLHVYRTSHICLYKKKSCFQTVITIAQDWWRQACLPGMISEDIQDKYFFLMSFHTTRDKEMPPNRELMA